jgi:hypothetical protein
VEADSVQAHVRTAIKRLDRAVVEVYRGLASRPAARPQVWEYVRQAMQLDGESVALLGRQHAEQGCQRRHNRVK